VLLQNKEDGFGGQFFKTLVKMASSSVLSLAKSENTRPKITRVSERGKTLTRLASGFVFLTGQS
jgi:hypothetical protein